MSELPIKLYIPCDICGVLVWKMSTVIRYPGINVCLSCYKKESDSE